MIFGITINGKHSFDDFGQMVASRNTGAPKKKSSTKTVPHMSGFYDFSAIYGAVSYESREVTYTFELMGDDEADLQTQKSELLAWLATAQDSDIFDDDITGWHFVGSFDSASWDEGDEGESGTLEVTFLCQPFLVADEETTQTVQPGSGSVAIIGQPVNATASTASGSANITIAGVTQSVGTQPVRLSAQLSTGSNPVTVTGSAVTLKWHEQRL